MDVEKIQKFDAIARRKITNTNPINRAGLKIMEIKGPTDVKRKDMITIRKTTKITGKIIRKEKGRKGKK